MDAIDRSDQYRERGPGFACKAHYKKWYKKAYFAILDFMVLNSFFAWNMSVAEVVGRLKVKRSDFYAVLAEEMIEFVDNTRGDDVDANLPEADPLNGHAPMPINHRECMRCAVCKLEEKWIDRVGIPK
ncbi:hypothetical protein HJC23_003006 [Cyclotella cryptica]|uniref:PiggyBac transposable element-derived protein domain-containing protein n=1 Tax=Cyclotella cryptica TaxID=29204 RepID=A0ABD3PTA7_9STRA